MTFEQVVLLLSLIGGRIVATAELTWKIFESSYKKKKVTAQTTNRAVTFLTNPIGS